MHLPIAILDGLSPGMLILLGALAVLLFGERLPEITRTWGKKFMDLKKNVQSIQDELRSAAYSATSAMNSSLESSVSSMTSAIEGISDSSTATAADVPAEPDIDDRDYEEATAPKFQPPGA
jgi:sec-independent protein translocase protein TatA